MLWTYSSRGDRLAVSLFAFALSLTLWLPARTAKAQRFGTVAGTWQACNETLLPLRVQLSTLAKQSKASGRKLNHLRHRLAVELDRCSQLADAPLDTFLEVINTYRSIGMDERALSVGLDAIDRLGDALPLVLNVAQIYYALGDKARAVPMLEEVLKRSPNELVANQILGAYYYDKGELERAVPRLIKVVEAQPDVFESNAALGDACLQLKQLDCAGKYLGRASQLKPEDVLLSIKVGDLFQSRGEYASAIEPYERALKADPKRWAAHLGLGRTFAHLDLLESAEAALTTAANLAPNELDPAVEASRVSRRLDRPLLGIQLLRRSLGKTDPTPEAVVELSLALLNNRETAAAGKLLADVPKSFAKDDRIQAVTGDAALALGNYKVALQHYRQARTIKADAPAYAIREARALRQLSQPSVAVEVLEPMVQRDERAATEWAEALVDTAMVRGGTGDLAEAQALLERAVPVAKGNRAPLALAVVRAARGNTSGAEDALDKATDGGPTQLARAWVASTAKRDDEVLALMAKDTRPQVLALRALSLDRLERSLEAWKLLSATTQKDLEGWRSYTLDRAVETDLHGKHYDEALALLPKELSTDMPKHYRTWLVRAGLVSALAAGQPLTTKELESSSNNELDAFLGAALFDAADDPDHGLRMLKIKSTSPALARLRERLELRQAMRFWARRDTRRARRLSKSVNAETPAAEKLNRIVITSSSRTKLVQEMAPFIAENLPEAFFNSAISAEGAEARGPAIEWLTKLLTFEVPAALRSRAQDLLELKQRLYR